jgi:hypothetical protein
MGEIKFYLAGVKFRKEEDPLAFKEAELDIISTYNQGEDEINIYFRPQPDNEFDSNVIQVFLGADEDEYFMGFVPRACNSQILALMETEFTMKVSLKIEDTTKLYQKYQITVQWESE